MSTARVSREAAFRTAFLFATLHADWRKGRSRPGQRLTLSVRDWSRHAVTPRRLDVPR